MTFKRKLGEAYVRYKLRSNIGQSYTGEIQGIINGIVSGGVIVMLVEKYAHILIPWQAIVIAYVLQKYIEYRLGLADEKHLHLTAYLNNYNAEHLNPYQKEIKEMLVDIKSKLS